jgi:hypothetical protein
LLFLAQAVDAQGDSGDGDALRVALGLADSVGNVFTSAYRALQVLTEVHGATP